jgi:hypothetical protein
MRRPLRHRAVAAAISAFNHNPWGGARLELLPRYDQPLYSEDGLWTYHAHSFVDEPRFVHAYERAMQAGGFDYGIRWRVHTILWAAALASRLEGAFVECGTGRGFMASAICAYLDWRDRPFYLYDTFMPTTPDERGVQSPDGPINDRYANGPDAVAANFAEWPSVRLVVGRIPETLGEVERVAFLHVDLNHAAPEEAAIRHFWPRLAVGGVMVLDDYGFEGYERQRVAADRLSHELGFSVLALPTGQGLVVK